MQTFNKLMLPFLFVFFTVGNLSAQDFNRWAIELDGGVNYANMDVESLISPMAKGGLRFNMSDAFGLKGDFEMGTLEGGKDKYDRSFVNEYMRYGLKGYLNVGKMANFHQSMPGVGLQAHAGINRIHTEITDGDQLLYPGFENGDDYTSEDFAVSFGGMLQFKVSSTISLNIEGSYYMTATDRMDGYDANIPANNYDDRYTTATIGLGINLGGAEEHADWVDLSVDKEVENTANSNKEAIEELEEKLKDEDEDGVIDAVDQDNETKEEVRVTTKGVPMDTDYDGIPDYLDDCPVDSGIKANDGCPEGWDSLQKAKTEKARKAKEKAEKAKADSDKKESAEKGDKANKETEASESAGKYTNIPNQSKENPNEASNFFIIGGSFKSESNAIDYKNYLQSEGFSNSQILFVESLGNYRVAFKEYNDHQSAKSALEDIRTNFNENAWILMY